MTSESDRRVTAPRRPDGRPYNYELMLADGRRRSYADRLGDFLPDLIPGYGELTDPVARAEARVRHAVSVQAVLQARLVVDQGTEGCGPEQIAVLLGDRAVPPSVREWSAPVPLVLVDAFYAPVTDVPRPVASGSGELIWLDAIGEDAYVRSLDRWGVVIVAERVADGGEPATSA